MTSTMKNITLKKKLLYLFPYYLSYFYFKTKVQPIYAIPFEFYCFLISQKKKTMLKQRNKKLILVTKSRFIYIFVVKFNLPSKPIG